jgi:hypothetical protein
MHSVSPSTIDPPAMLLEIVDLAFTHVGQTQPTPQGVHLTVNPDALSQDQQRRLALETVLARQPQIC